ncbi:hypothetical protein SALBM135S_04576 [Streptomyces alboniger]
MGRAGGSGKDVEGCGTGGMDSGGVDSVSSTEIPKSEASPSRPLL